MKSVNLFWLKIVLIIAMILNIIFIPILIKNIISSDKYTLYISDNNRNELIKNEEYSESEMYILYLSLDIILLAVFKFLYNKISKEIKFINGFEERDNEE